MPGFTNRGKFAILATYFRADGTQSPGAFSARLTKTTAPTADINLFSELTEIAAGNGYSAGGIALARNATDFDVITEDDVNDRALIQTKDLVWNASGGPIPSDSVGAEDLVICDDEVSPQVIGYFSLGGTPIVISDTQALTLQNPEFRLNEV